jgi:hypothetical protein
MRFPFASSAPIGVRLEDLLVYTDILRAESDKASGELVKDALVLDLY